MAKLKFNPAAYQDLGAYALLKNVVENGHLVAEDATPIPPTPPTYKVYTALLTQSGGDSPFTLNSGPLTIGVTYEIVDILIGKVNTFTILNPGTGYVDETSGTSGGNGSSLSFGITQTGGVIDSLTIIDPGAGYHVNDIVTINNGNGNATVRIDSVLSDDFTNVGASSNTNGVKFIATGTTPTSWLAGSTLGANSAAPTVTILENTIGNIPWTYSSEGVYQATSSLLNDSKTLLFVQATSNNSPNNVGYYLRFSDPDVLELTLLVEGYGPSDNWLLNTPIEIRIYN